MSFNGFTDQTIEYFLNIYLDNTKANFEANRALYEAHVKVPLRALHESLVPAMLEIDPGLCVKASRCVSGAYNDARYAKSNPIKHYMYLHFCAETGRETDVPGFFMDASFNGYRCGLQLYHRTTQGMTTLRDAVLRDERRFLKMIRTLESGTDLTLEGESYQKDRFPSVPPPVKTWLNKKSWWVGKTCPPDGVFFTPGLAAQLADRFQALGNLYAFIKKSLDG